MNLERVIYRPATEPETKAWLNGWLSGPEWVETEEGLMLTEVRADPSEPIDVWLRIPDGEEESEAEANTFVTEDGYRVEWYLTAVGLVSSVEFDTLADAYDWLEREGFEDYTA